MKTNVLGYPRIGAKRELKRAIESYWKQEIGSEQLTDVAQHIRKSNWENQRNLGIDLIPSNDFSLYDQVLDTALLYGIIPERYREISDSNSTLDLYFVMARGLQNEDHDITAMEMTKWFDTNYHYIVPEFISNQEIIINPEKPIQEYREAKALGIETKPVLISPVTFLALGKSKEPEFDKLTLLERILPEFIHLLKLLEAEGAEYIQIDEPCLALDLSDEYRNAITHVFKTVRHEVPGLKIILTNYFDCYGENLQTALSLPVHCIHLDLIRCSSQIKDVLQAGISPKTCLSLGLIDGRNIWKNNYEHSLKIISEAIAKLGRDRVWIATSCSLLHVPYDLRNEKNDINLNPTIKNWLAFAHQKLEELSDLKKLSSPTISNQPILRLQQNQEANASRSTSPLIHHKPTQQRVSALTTKDSERYSNFTERQKTQRSILNLPLFPTTTIGSFPQTREVRSWRRKLANNQLSPQQYDDAIKIAIAEAIALQEEIGLDVLVHGEFERNDMVEYFGEQLQGFAFSQFGWVQSYGTRCVKPPIIFGDVYRSSPMTVEWTTYAQSLTHLPVKGMLTGPITILQWSFVRNDQDRSTTCNQIALAIRDEVQDLEKAGIKVIQIDEPAIREGLPVRKENWKNYLKWAVNAFRISSSGVSDSTQIHTHMCYSEFNDIIEDIAQLDADVITIETSRSEMELLDAFVEFKYPNEIGPGVYDIHSPRVPTTDEIEKLLYKAQDLLPADNIWVNPDCGLKTRDWKETKHALKNMVNAAKELRKVHQLVE